MKKIRCVLFHYQFNQIPQRLSRVHPKGRGGECSILTVIFFKDSRTFPLTFPHHHHPNSSQAYQAMQQAYLFCKNIQISCNIEKTARFVVAFPMLQLICKGRRDYRIAPKLTISSRRYDVLISRTGVSEMVVNVGNISCSNFGNCACILQKFVYSTKLCFGYI